MDLPPREMKRRAALYAYYFRRYLSLRDDMAVAFGDIYADSLHLPHAREVTRQIESQLKDYNAGYEEGYQEATNTERLAHLDTLHRLVAYRYQVPQGYCGLQLEKLKIEAIKRLIEVTFEEKALAGFEKAVREQVLLNEILTESG